MRLKKLMQRFEMLTYKWDTTFSLLDLFFHDHTGRWGFKLFTIDGLYSLLAFEFSLPNITGRSSFYVIDWDVLFLHRYLWKEYDNLSDSDIWGIKYTGWNKFKLWFLGKVFK